MIIISDFFTSLLSSMAYQAVVKLLSWPKLLLGLLKPGMESILEGKLGNFNIKSFTMKL